MKTLLVVLVLIALVAGLAVTALYSRQQSDRLDSANRTLSDLSAQVAKLQDSLANIPTPAAPTASRITQIVSQLQPAVLRIDVAGNGFVAAGSGFFVRQDGYFVTNQHVIDATTSIKVTLASGEQFSASVKSSDPALDIAICQVSANRQGFPVLSLGSMNDIVIGEDVVAIGFPLGTDLPGMASFTHGIISATRTINNQRYLQTDVTINPGNSGGCLVDYSLKVIGITTSAVLPRGADIENIGLAIPADVVLGYLNANLK